MFSSKKKILVWAAFHLLILVIFLFSMPVSISTSLYSVLPDTNPVKQLTEVEQRLSDGMNSNMTILIGHTEFEQAKVTADLFAEQLRQVPGIGGIQYKVDTDSLSLFQDYLHQYRYHFLTPEVKSLLSADQGYLLGERAFFTLSSPVSMGALDYLDEDPFLLANDTLQYFLNSGLLGNMAVGIRDSVLTREYQDRHWILITCKSDLSGVTVEIEENPVARILNGADALQERFSGTEFVFSGVPFHSYDSAQKSQREISLLSTLSSLAIVGMLLLVFRSGKPLIVTLTAIITGMATGLGVTFIVFSEIHIFTIVFGTSLIGISVDYSFHFFTEWAEGKKGTAVIRKILPGITIGLITTLLSYGAFTFSSFPLLKQMALFSIAGLCSTYISVLFLYSNLNAAGGRTINGAGQALRLVRSVYDRIGRIPRSVKVILILVIIGFTGWGLKDLTLNNNVRDLYTMSDQLFEWEKLSSEILDHGSSGVYLVVEGDSLEGNLQIEEQLAVSLNQLINQSVLESAMSLSTLFPSKRVQKENLDLVSNRLAPLFANQMGYLGFDANQIQAHESLFLQLKNHTMDFDDLMKLPLSSLSSALHIGEIDHRYYTSVLLFGISDMEALQSQIESFKGVYLVNKVDDTSKTLHQLSLLALIIIGASYLVIFIGLIFRYGFRGSLRIVVIPIVASFCAVALIVLLKLPVNLFVIVGLILIPGMGTDYIILLSEADKRDSAVVLSITLSMMTSVLAFGLLGFTSIARVFGITVSFGVCMTYLITLVFTKRETGLPLADAAKTERSES